MVGVDGLLWPFKLENREFRSRASEASCAQAVRARDEAVEALRKEETARKAAETARDEAVALILADMEAQAAFHTRLREIYER